MECQKCKARGWCEIHPYPILAKMNALFKNKPIKEFFYGSAPNVFVGRHGYPNLNVGFLAPVEIKDSTIYDSPREWRKQDFDQKTVLALRQELVNSRFKTNIKGSVKFLDYAKEVGMAEKPVEIEVNIKNTRQGFEVSPFVAPMGPRAELKRISITSNPKIGHAVERVVSDNEYKATSALAELYDKHYDENFLTKLLSTGNLGLKTERKLVPTRWAITAVDDTISKHLIDEIKSFQESEAIAFFNGYFGNYFLVMFFPGEWSYELIEIMVGKNPSVTTDYEPYSGRKEYVTETAGGYYAVRLAVCEKLREMQRQASVLVLRFITDEYELPLGVWVVREASRKSVSSKPLKFADKDLMINYAKAVAKRRFNLDIDDIIKKSRLLDKMNNQKKLTGFLR